MLYWEDLKVMEASWRLELELSLRGCHQMLLGKECNDVFQAEGTA